MRKDNDNTAVWSLVVILFALLIHCTLLDSPPTGISMPVSDWIRLEWNIAQSIIATDWELDSAFGVHPDRFKFEEMPGPFKCGDMDLAAGCYKSSSKTIQYDVNSPNVVRHEAGHAILHALGGNWKCYQHMCN